MPPAARQVPVATSLEGSACRSRRVRRRILVSAGVAANGRPPSPIG